MLNLVDVQASPELMAAVLVGLATVSAAVVNASAQVKVAREARRNSKPAPPASRRMMRWLLVGAALALGLGWSATAGLPAMDENTSASSLIGAGVTSALGPRATAPSGADDAMTAAVLHLARPLTDGQLVSLLGAYDLRTYAIDIRVGEESAWRPVHVAATTEEALSQARVFSAAAQQACAPATPSHTLAVAGDDTAAVEGAPAQAAGDTMRALPQPPASNQASIHAVRVIGRLSAATGASQDPAVARAEIMRFDRSWPTTEADLAAAPAACAGALVAAL